MIAPLVTIITVVFNDVFGIEKTILSVISQTFSNFEYIIIDGGSTDGTTEVIKKYESRLSYWISEKDYGIYDAMNKGIVQGNGKWVNFMNSGDTFYSNSVLENVFSNEPIFKDKALIYGFKYQNNLAFQPLPLEYLKKGVIMGNHQSMFFNGFLIGKENFIYNLKYPIYSDYDLVNRIFLKFGANYFVYLKQGISSYKGGGISSIVSKQKRIDKYAIVFREYGILGIIRSLLYRFF